MSLAVKRYTVCYDNCCTVPSVLWRCWLGGRKGIRPVKNWAVGCWRGICLECGADLHMSQLMPLPLTVSCFSKIQIGFAFLVPAHLGSPGKRAVKRVCVYVSSLFLSQVTCIWLPIKTSLKISLHQNYSIASMYELLNVGSMGKCFTMRQYFVYILQQCYREQ